MNYVQGRHQALVLLPPHTVVAYDGEVTGEWLQEQVGGYVELVGTALVRGYPGLRLIVNEVGALAADRQINLLASMIAAQPIFGPAILADHNDRGEQTPLFVHRALLLMVAAMEQAFNRAGNRQLILPPEG